MATQPPLQGKEIGWPPPSICKYPPDAAHEWVADVDNEIVVEVKGRPYVLTPLIKRYLDPYGLTTKVPRTPLEDPGGCPLCHSLLVSHSSIITFSKNQLLVPTCTRANLYVHISCSVKKDPGAWPIYRRSKRRESGNSPKEDNKLDMNIASVIV